ncbi:putative transport protein sec31 protein [Phaeoacremonium minimum UCRPA7]|uniref:Protein transport protein SEC31 n=1 Tax=Phaeoacremonium minimum (strain UCR-PA7) TaxID=1286976 RepID=R8BM48_PHAM7|nr:putative transport protein sec31 protein [Phaeoacremonium minimum UCRPA7]EOO00429.1 putative transport protein sec31 protein [Phaeoacremonium minimum UCRPA7]
MVRLREIPRTAAFAWSSGTSKPLLVTGTRAGAVDVDFSDETKLELWDLDLDNQEQGLELQPIASLSTESRFYDIAWGPPDADHPRGIIAGALENGALDLWDAEKLVSGDAEGAFMSRTQKHTGPIKSLQFNPLKPQILATAGAKGELFIYDVNDIANPFRLGSQGAHDLECIAWNRKVPHILATGGAGGFVTVWDLKTKKASLTLNNNRKPVSAIAWDPNNSTKLLTATPDDMTPVILLWDLRNSNAPERTLQGHEQGVLSLSWCQQDSDLLISCGKDNRTLVWNPQTGTRYGEFPEVTNWTFLTRFNPHNPTLSATASFDGKITIQTLQNTNPSTAQSAAQSNLDGEDFFTKAQTQPQGASFSLPKAPTWLERPIGASFGFGGKVVIFKKNATAPGQPRSSKVQLSHFSVDSDIGSATEKFEESLKTGDIKQICATHLEHAKTEEEKGDWLVMETLVSENPRQQVIQYMGFSKDEDADAADTDDAALDTSPAGSEIAKENGDLKKQNRLSSFFADGADGDDFLSDLAANKGAKTDSPFSLFGDGNTSLENSVTKALMLGNFHKAAEICLKQDRIADAFIIANCGGKELVDKVQATYLSQKKGSPSYLRLLSSVIAENLWDVVYNADLSDWKETMATLCTFAKPTEFPDLCEALGDRILESGSRKDASFCYLVGSKLEKVVTIWITELEEAEQAGMKESETDSTFSVHARSLQNFIEKVTVFRQVTKFQDSEKGLSSGWKLGALYDKYTEYADIVAAHGLLAVAQKYLDLLPLNYPAAEQRDLSLIWGFSHPSLLLGQVQSTCMQHQHHRSNQTPMRRQLNHSSQTRMLHLL